MLTRTVVLDESLSCRMHSCGNVSHTHTHTLLSSVCMCVVCASVRSIFAPHLLMTLKPTRGGKWLQPGWGGCVSSTLAVRLMSAATATILLIEEGIVDSTPRQTSYAAGSEPWDRTADASQLQRRARWQFSDGLLKKTSSCLSESIEVLLLTFLVHLPVYCHLIFLILTHLY